MAWRIWATPYINASDLTDTSIHQPFDPARNMVLKAVRTWILFLDDPVITSLALKIYTDSGGSPDTLIATSSSVSKADALALDSGIREVPFEFQTPVPLADGETYHFVLNGVGYAPTTSSYIGWRRAYPNPAYKAVYTPTLVNVLSAPHELVLIGAEY